jgi:hypothetical protein
LDILWNVPYAAVALRPPVDGMPVAFVFWIIFILGILEIIAFVGGFALSWMGRSELNILLSRGPGSSPVGKTKLSLLFYMIGLIIAVSFFAIFWVFALLVAFILKDTFGGAVAGFFALVMLVFAILLLPVFLVYVSQLVQVCKMRTAAADCERAIAGGNGIPLVPPPRPMDMAPSAF